MVIIDLIREVTNHLNHTMPGGWSGRDAPIAWQPRSPTEPRQLYS